MDNNLYLFDSNFFNLYKTPFDQLRQLSASFVLNVDLSPLGIDYNTVASNQMKSKLIDELIKTIIEDITSISNKKFLDSNNPIEWENELTLNSKKNLLTTQRINNELSNIPSYNISGVDKISSMVYNSGCLGGYHKLFINNYLEYTDDTILMFDNIDLYVSDFFFREVNSLIYNVKK